MATGIEWTDATWHVKSAAARIGISAEEYLALRRSGLKHCWRCRRWLEIPAFGVDRTRADALAALCRSCSRVPPKQIELIRQTPAERDRRRYSRDEKYRSERRQHAHARARGVAPLPAEGIEALTEKFGGHCAYCPAPATTWDHIVPVSKGGRTEPGNMLPACASCNSRKGNRHVEDFIETAGIVITEALDAALALAYAWGALEVNG